jgi:coenzyme F420-dependent glucose-6-phosphate dehydrogenase
VTAFYYFCGDEAWQPEQLVDIAVAAEQAGFDGVMVSEHFHPWVDDAGSSGFAFSVLGAIAQATTTLRMVTGVTTPLFRFHPGIVAQAAATLDRLSGGRFDLGIGTGENINEGPLGYHFPKYAERAARMREALEIMRRLLDDEKLTFSGEYYSTDRARLYSPPERRLPILLAAGGPKSATLAGEMADGIITSVKDPAETFARVIEPARRAAKAAGRPAPSIVTTRWVLFATNDDEAWRALQPWRGLRVSGSFEAVDPEELRQLADGLPRGEVLARYTRVSGPDEFVAAYRPLVEEVQADVITITTTSTDEHGTIRMLGDQVLPRLRQIAEG